MRLLKIGRSSKCDITISSERVSSLHAEMTLLNNGDILLEDKGSTNGTFVQNRPIKPGKSVSVRRGDAIRFADVELQWAQVPMESNAGYKAVWGIGTDFHNDFQVAGATVSRFHATVKQSNDGKFYIFDHSTNGTTVDGVKIMPNTAHQIKKKSIINCGGVNVDLTQGNKIDWPNELWKPILAIVAAVLLAGGIGFGIYQLVNKDITPEYVIQPNGDTVFLSPNGDTIRIGRKCVVTEPPVGIMTDEKIYESNKTAIVFLQGIFHYKVTAGDLDLEKLGLPTSVLPTKDGYVFTGELTTEQIIKECSDYSGTGFFISEGGKDEGKLITNLHIVKPWLFEGGKAVLEMIESSYRRTFARKVQDRDFINHLQGMSATDLSAYISQIKVEGVLDKIIMVPYGKRYDPENYIGCVVLSCGDSDPQKDVALLQSVRGEIPKGCTYVDADNMMDISEDALRVTKHVCTLGFPFGTALQNIDDEKGLQVFFNGGNINKDADVYHLFINAVSFHGASGSPIFNDQGKLIGVLNAGVDQSQGFNQAMKARYVRELLDSKPYKK